MNTSLPISIVGTGVYAPGEPINNAELSQLAGIEFDHSKTEQRLGIYSRHNARLRGIDETTADFATQAARAAIDNAGLKPSDIGLFIVGTDTPEHISPSTAILVQGRIQGGEQWAAAFDVAASCASFTLALDTAVRIMATDASIRYAVVVGVYNMPAFIRPDDAFGLSIFADGAGAVVIGREGKGAYLTSQHLSDGTQWNYIGIYSGGSRQPVTHERLEAGEYGLQSLQPLPGDRNVRLWPMVVEKLLAKASVPIEEVDHFIFTQINRSVIERVMEALNQPLHKTSFVMDRYGYTGSGCVPMALHHALQEGRLKRGDVVALVASGAGLSVGSCLLRL